MTDRPRHPQGTLTLVLTRRCPVRCGFCPQGFGSKDMSKTVLLAALHRLGPRLKDRAHIKLFGGEPLLKPGLVRLAVLEAREAGGAVSFELSTRATLLDAGMFRFLAAHPEVEVALGHPRAWARRLTNVSLNFILHSGEKAGRVLERLRAAIALGVRRFNFLPV